MRQIILLGSPGAKRTVWLERSAGDAGVPIRLLDWKDYREGRGGLLRGDPASRQIFLKIDPPVWDSCCLEELDRLAKSYVEDLEKLGALEETGGVRFLNHPRAICALLDKKECKKRLKEQGIPVTEALEEKIGTMGELLEAMEQKRLSQVFLKPVRGSGAAGVAAFRYQKKTGHMVLYTCGMEDPVTGRLVNTKRLRRFEGRDQIEPLMAGLLKTDCMAERWYAKAEHRGFSYDLRAVVQDGQVDFILARLSKGPVTNLHLNNHPLQARKLGLPAAVLEEVEEICKKAAGCWSGLRSAGIDVLLEKGSRKPRVIEMNGQGDLIYEDFYNENKIYRHQAEMMKEWLYGED